MITAIGCFIRNLLSMFKPHNSQTEERLRLMGVEQDIHIIKRVLSLDPLDVHADSKHLDAEVSKSVMNWLPNWLDDYDFTSKVESVIDDGNLVENAADDWLNNQDWDYNLRDCLDWDKVADRVVEKLDWETIISDNDIVTEHHIDLDDIMLKSDHMSEDDLVTRDDLSTMVVDELKRDWFNSLLSDEVKRHFKDTLQSVRQTEEANCRNAIDDEIESKVALLVAERLQEKFGDSFDIWFHNLIAHSVKSVISEMIVAAHSQVVANNDKEVQS